MIHDLLSSTGLNDESLMKVWWNFDESLMKVGSQTRVIFLHLHIQKGFGDLLKKGPTDIQSKITNGF